MSYTAVEQISPSILEPISGEIVVRVTRANRETEELVATGNKLSLGSAPNCSLRIADEDVRPIHCLILRSSSRTTVRRLTCDTRLNGQPFEDAILAPGDTLQLGEVSVRIMTDSREPAIAGRELLEESQDTEASPPHSESTDWPDQIAGPVASSLASQLEQALETWGLLLQEVQNERQAFQADMQAWREERLGWEAELQDCRTSIESLHERLDRMDRQAGIEAALRTASGQRPAEESQEDADDLRARIQRITDRIDGVNRSDDGFSFDSLDVPQASTTPSPLDLANARIEELLKLRSTDQESTSADVDPCEPAADSQERDDDDTYSCGLLSARFLKQFEEEDNEQLDSNVDVTPDAATTSDSRELDLEDVKQDQADWEDDDADELEEHIRRITGRLNGTEEPCWDSDEPQETAALSGPEEADSDVPTGDLADETAKTESPNSPPDDPNSPLAAYLELRDQAANVVPSLDTSAVSLPSPEAPNDNEELEESPLARFERRAHEAEELLAAHDHDDRSTDSTTEHATELAHEDDAFEAPEEDAVEFEPQQYSQPTADDDDADQSVREYMARLLQRVSGDSAAPRPKTSPRPQRPPQTPIPQSDQPSNQPPQHQPDPSAVVDPKTKLTPERGGADNSPEAYAPRSVPPERNFDTEGLREVANWSARNAILLFDKKRAFQRLLGKIPLLLVGTFCGAILLYWGIRYARPTLYLGSVLAFGAAIVSTVQAGGLLLKLQLFGSTNRPSSLAEES